MKVSFCMTLHCMHAERMEKYETKETLSIADIHKNEMFSLCRFLCFLAVFLLSSIILLLIGRILSLDDASLSKTPIEKNL